MTMLFLLVTLNSAFTADAPTDTTTKELEKFQGTWIVVSFKYIGTGATEDIVPAGKKITIEKNEIVFHFGEKPVIGTFTIDPTKKPKQFDLVPPVAKKGDPVCPAIYDFDGETLTICKASYVVAKTFESGKEGRSVRVGERPTTFMGKKTELLILKRDKK